VKAYCVYRCELGYTEPISPTWIKEDKTRKCMSMRLYADVGVSTLLSTAEGKCNHVCTVRILSRQLKYIMKSVCIVRTNRPEQTGSSCM
jgi:hypothetical protein